MTTAPTRPTSRPTIVRTSRTWSEAGEEPTLAEMLADPIVHLVMARDHLTRADVERAVSFGQRLLRNRLCSLCAA
jgi:hypothetical protein